jgi:hypothetical protein
MTARRGSLAPVLLDRRFLVLHPRTALWWKEREVCAVCVFVVRDGHAWRCDAVAGGSSKEGAGCMRARDEGQACGPDALLFKPAPA